MLSALNSEGIEVNIESVVSPDGTIRRKGYVCKCCGEHAVVNYGPKRHYFSHQRKNSSCIAALYDCRMTDWHHNWQWLFPEGTQEHYEKAEDGSFRRADVLCNNYVVEFQHSYINDEEVKSRTEHFMKSEKTVIWLFDMRKEWSKEKDFAEDRYHRIENHKLLRLKTPYAADGLPVGMRAIDTSSVILIAEVQSDDNEISLIRLFKYYSLVLGFDYGCSREKLAEAIQNGKIHTNLTIKSIRNESIRNKPNKKVAAGKTYQEKKNNNFDVRSFGNDEHYGYDQYMNIFKITNHSIIDMTGIISDVIQHRGCYISNKQHIDNDSSGVKIEYEIGCNYKTRRDLINMLESLANDGAAPLYGAHFY